MKWDGIHWNVNELLPYQRQWNFVNSIRGTGKTYSFIWFCLDESMNKNKRFLYFVRNVSQKRNAGIWEATEKVRYEQYPDENFKMAGDCLLWEADKDVWEPLGWTVCVKEVELLKKIGSSYTDCYYGLFDEYVKEDNTTKYVNGWREPENIIKIYDSIDRRQDKLKMFFFANDITPYNPYHMFPMFNIPIIPKGKIWKSKSVLFQNYEPTLKWWEEFLHTDFANLISGSEYEKYAVKGEYLNLTDHFVEKRPERARNNCVIEFQGMTFGIWYERETGKFFIDKKFDKGNINRFALTNDDHTENTILTKGKGSTYLKWLGKAYKMGSVRYVNQEVKAKAEDAVRLLI